MRLWTKMVTGAIAAIGTLSAPTAGRAAIIVDDFTSQTAPSAWPLTTTASTPHSGFGFNDSGLADVLGGKRAADIGYTTMDVPGFDAFRADLFHAPGLSFVDVSSSSGAQGRFSLAYGLPYAVGSAAFGLTQSADTKALRVTFLAYDAANDQPLTIQTTAFHQIDPTHSFSVSLPDTLLSAPGAQTVDIPLADFWTNGGGTLDGLEFFFVGGKAADYRIDSITLIPEPTSAALFACGATLLTTARRRRT
jgi:hypothetical protein